MDLKLFKLKIKSKGNPEFVKIGAIKKILIL